VFVQDLRLWVLLGILQKWRERKERLGWCVGLLVRASDFESSFVGPLSLASSARPDIKAACET
jgi:hypothetical protein